MTPATGTLPVVAGRRSARVVARSLFALTKPRIIELLLVTTIPTMLLAQRGLPSVRVLVVTLVGGAFAAGSANTINCYIDRDIDAIMKRTSRRPLARKAPPAVVRPAEALVFGIVLGIASTLLLGTLVNWLSAVLADAAILFYVFVYTLGLKRRTPSNIVIGGAAGCFPVLIGWSAVTDTVSLPAVILFAVIFFWTPPHFWALAMKFRDDYAAASVPMLPVVATPAVVAQKILVYSYVMVAVTLGLAPYVLIVLDVELIVDITDDLLDHVLDRDQARDPAVFVDHDRHVVAAVAKFAQQHVQALGFRHEHRRPQIFAHVEDGGGAAGKQAQQILGQQYARHVIALAVEHRKT